MFHCVGFFEDVIDGDYVVVGVVDWLCVVVCEEFADDLVGRRVLDHEL